MSDVLSKEQIEAGDDPWRLLCELVKEAGLELQVGLRKQGHFDRVSQMRSARATWEQIGAQIHWSPEAVQSMYEIELRAEFEALLAELASLQGRTCATCSNYAAFELCDDIGTCPVVNIRIHRETAETFHCSLWAARDTARPEGEQ